VSRYRSLALFIGLGFLWGGSFPAIEVGLRDFPPLLFAAARYDLAGLVLLCYAVIAADRWRPSGWADLTGILGAGAFLIAGNSLLFVGQQFTTGGVAAVIYSLIPILTTGIAWVLLPDERHSVVGLVGILFGLAGVFVIAQPSPATLLAPDVVGKGLVLLAAFSVALGSVLVRRSGSTLPDTAFIAWAMLVGAALLHGFSLASGESPAAVELTPLGLASLAYIALFATAMAFLIYFFLLGNYGPLETNLVSYIVPVVATVLGAVLLSEPVTVWTVVGFGLILTGFGLLKGRALRAELRRAFPDWT
jgi:drug/metabolite transporter (DMT)-like permease